MQTDNICLGEEQISAVTQILYFINNSTDIAFSLVGPAGTGKTTIIKNIVQYLDSHSISYCLCAPTHKAALVLERATDRTSITIHKLLALHPKLDILKLDFKFLQFATHKSTLAIPYKGVVICDEASMINDDLYDLLCDKCKEFNSKIVFVSDKKQLMPVKGKEVSKVYQIKDNTAVLSKIYRQSSDNALIPILAELRENSIDKFYPATGISGSIYCYNGSELKEFMKEVINTFKTAIDRRDILYSKVLAYTNERVSMYNYYIRKLLWEDNDEYHKGEFLTSYENDSNNNYYNSMDYIVVKPPTPINIEIPICNSSVPGYELELYDSFDKKIFTIKIISRKTNKVTLDIIGQVIENVRMKALKNKQYWKQYYSIVKAFATPFDITYDGRIVKKKTFDYGYACTVHRSQGSSLNEVFIDMTDINKNLNPLELRQLQYVALSRTRNNVYILQ